MSIYCQFPTLRDPITDLCCHAIVYSITSMWRSAGEWRCTTGSWSGSVHSHLQTGTPCRSAGPCYARRHSNRRVQLVRRIPGCSSPAPRILVISSRSRVRGVGRTKVREESNRSVITWAEIKSRGTKTNDFIWQHTENAGIKFNATEAIISYPDVLTRIESTVFLEVWVHFSNPSNAITLLGYRSNRQNLDSIRLPLLITEPRLFLSEHAPDHPNDLGCVDI
jgi:hypothetical protein